MTSLIIKRVLEEANYMLSTKNTIREIASVFNVSKVLFTRIYMKDCVI